MITKEMKIIEALQVSPEVAEIFHRFGMGCVGCMGITGETIENGAKMQRIPLEKLLQELNGIVKP